MIRNICLCLLLAFSLVSCDKVSNLGAAEPLHVAIVSHQSKYVIDPARNQYITMGPASSKTHVADSGQVKATAKVKFALQGPPSRTSVKAPFYVALVDNSMNVIYRHDAVVHFKPDENKKSVITNITFQPAPGIKVSDHSLIVAFNIDKRQKLLLKQHKSRLSRVPSAKEIASLKLKRYSEVAYNDST